MNFYNRKSSFFLLKTLRVSVFMLCAALCISCTFDYSAAVESDREKSDITMDNIEYVRVRGGDVQARFHAEHAERWESRQTMELRYFSFEQMEDKGETINAEGKAGAAVVQLVSGDITLRNGVSVNIESEDIIIKTAGLEWKDKDKLLFGNEGAEVEVERSDGTKFSGRGFSANVRERTWAFSGNVKGKYVDEDEEGNESSGGSSETMKEVQAGTETKIIEKEAVQPKRSETWQIPAEEK